MLLPCTRRYSQWQLQHLLGKPGTTVTTIAAAAAAVMLL
jgi:hypothetical protein